MQSLSIEDMAEKIHFGKTKEYFKEALSSYYNGNYRSSVVMLWSVAICDIVYKLQSLIDLYDDDSAKNILQLISDTQDKDPKSATWEITLLDEVFNKTNLIDTAEYENLRFLQKQRHLSAHPVLNKERELHSPRKETVRSLLLNVLVDLLTKPPFYTQHILDKLLSDIAESKNILNTNSTIKKYVENRYFLRTNPKVEMSLFRSLWKIVFKLDNEMCNENRLINLRVLEIIAKRNQNLLEPTIRGDSDFYSNIASSGDALSYLVYFLSSNSKLHELMSEAAKIKISHCIAEDFIGKTVGWFVKESLDHHANDLKEWIISDERPIFTLEQFSFVLDISESEEWQTRFCEIISEYYVISNSFSQADSRFQTAIPKFIHLFDKETLVYLVNKIEKNDQCHSRRQARQDYIIIKERIDSVFEEGEFEYKNYFWFSRKIGLND